MPIVISRKTGEIISKPNYTQEQIDTLWEIVLRNWIKLHPEELLNLKTVSSNDQNKA